MPTYSISAAQDGCGKLVVTNATNYGEVAKSSRYLLLVTEYKSKQIEFVTSVPNSSANNIDTWSIDITKDGWYRFKLVYAEVMNINVAQTLGTVGYYNNKFWLVVKATNGTQSIDDTDYYLELTGNEWNDLIESYIFLDVRVVCNTLNCLLEKGKALLHGECKDCDPCKDINNYYRLRVYYWSAIQYWDLGNKRKFQDFITVINRECCENCG